MAPAPRALHAGTPKALAFGDGHDVWGNTEKPTICQIRQAMVNRFSFFFSCVKGWRTGLVILHRSQAVFVEYPLLNSPPPPP